MRNKLNVFFLGSSFVGTETERKYNQTKKKKQKERPLSLMSKLQTVVPLYI